MSHDADAGAIEGKSPGPLPDFCGYCGTELRGTYARAWEWMKSDEGLLVAANFCANGGKCEQRAQREAAEVVAYLRHRQSTDERWET